MKRLYAPLPYLIAGLLILSVTACARLADALPGIIDDRVPDPEAVLVNTEWVLESYGEPGAETPVLEETDVTLRFGEEGNAGGFGGCNTFGAHYVVSNGTIAFTELIATEIACPGEGVMEQEQHYFRALRTADEFELTDDQLRIWYDDGQRVLSFASAEES